MALDRTNFGIDSSSANTGLPRNWVYKTTDTVATVNTAGYFNGVADLVVIGDRVTAITSTGGTPSYDVYFVSANASGVVDVNDGAAIDGVTDTD